MTLWFSGLCCTSNAQSPIWDTRFCLASSSSLLDVCEQQRLWRDCAYAQSRLSLLLFGYVISTLVVCAGSYYIYLSVFLFPKASSCNHSADSRNGRRRST